jgi:hypothetical protein
LIAVELLSSVKENTIIESSGHDFRKEKAMRNRITRNSYVIVLAAIALAAATFPWSNTRLQAAEARAQEKSVFFVGSQLFGIAPGQTARFCVGTLTSRGPALDWAGHITDERGNLLFQLPAKHSPEGEWRCADAPRSSLPVAGEGTGRVQVAATLCVKAPLGTKSTALNGLFELVSDENGSTVAGGLIFWAVTHDNDVQQICP